MNILLDLGIVVVTFLFMEGVAWFTHKYIMHGFLWSWHKSHHVKHNHTFEMNDLFAVIFSLPSIALIAYGFMDDVPTWIKYVGFGIMAYGIFYSLFHDILVHRRIKLRIKVKNRYLKRIMKAHYIHHKISTKNGAEAFGFLYAPKKYQT